MNVRKVYGEIRYFYDEFHVFSESIFIMNPYKIVRRSKIHPSLFLLSSALTYFPLLLLI